MLAVGAASLALLGSSLTVAQAADDPTAVPESSLSTEEDLADPAADELPLAEEDTEGDPESEPSEEDMALGIEGTADEPAAAPDTAEDGQPVTMETGTQTACDEADGVGRRGGARRAVRGLRIASDAGRRADCRGTGRTVAQ
ncbi:hypothetical protein [Streptomyces bottropensis]|uniref:hypothetical protein n=1 Tax=Streptomyces bottropensis TaxID=42235 RepID=UPI0036D0A644